jgi:uncharacterized membrane protein YeaQ/YmgE (transglycosylase-associated protein family)
VGLIGWIISGALAGWAVNVIIGGRDRRGQGCLVNILVGVVGAVLGGLLYRMITGREINLEFDLPSFGIAVLGAAGRLAADLYCGPGSPVTSSRVVLVCRTSPLWSTRRWKFISSGSPGRRRCASCWIIWSRNNGPVPESEQAAARAAFDQLDGLTDARWTA